MVHTLLAAIVILGVVEVEMRELAEWMEYIVASD
jgi:hypothetical protein